jgi:hypothetical protein
MYQILVGLILTISKFSIWTSSKVHSYEPKWNSHDSFLCTCPIPTSMKIIEQICYWNLQVQILWIHFMLYMQRMHTDNLNSNFLCLFGALKNLYWNWHLHVSWSVEIGSYHQEINLRNLKVKSVTVSCPLSCRRHVCIMCLYYNKSLWKNVPKF